MRCIKQLEDAVPQANYAEKVVIYLAICEFYTINKDFPNFSKTLSEL